MDLNISNTSVQSEHPLLPFRFCPICGAEGFEIQNSLSKRCNSCGFSYYANPRAATVAIIVNDSNEILVARRAKNPSIGMLDLPGGFVDLDETAEEAVMREVREETGMEVEKLEYLFSIPNKYPYSGIVVRTMDLFYVCQVEDFSSLAAQDDVAELFWMKLEDISLSVFAFESIRKGLIRYYELKSRK